MSRLVEGTSDEHDEVYHRLLVVTGPPGAGKSTVSALVAERLPRSVLVSGDEFFGFVRRGFVEPWLPEAHRQNASVIEAAAGAAGRFVSAAYATIYDGVVGPWFLENFRAAAGLDQVDYLVLLPPLSTCLQRIRGREHEFRDLVAARSMHEQFAKASIEPRHILIDVSDDPAETADGVLSLWSHGQLRS